MDRCKCCWVTKVEGLPHHVPGCWSRLYHALCSLTLFSWGSRRTNRRRFGFGGETPGHFTLTPAKTVFRAPPHTHLALSGPCLKTWYPGTTLRTSPPSTTTSLSIAQKTTQRKYNTKQKTSAGSQHSRSTGNLARKNAYGTARV